MTSDDHSHTFCTLSNSISLPLNTTVPNHFCFSLYAFVFFPLSICEPVSCLVAVYSLQNFGILQTKEGSYSQLKNKPPPPRAHTQTQPLQPTSKIGISIEHGNSCTWFVTFPFVFPLAWVWKQKLRGCYCVSIPICCRADFRSSVV
jgi:hypothetical protein